MNTIHRHASLLENTSAVTEDGRLLVVHHATNRAFDTFGKSSDMGFHFGAWSQAAKRRENMISRGEGKADDKWTVVSAVLAIRNPLVIPDDPGIWGLRWVAGTLSRFLDDNDRNALKELSRRLWARGGMELKPEESSRIADEWFRILRASVRRAGHDGIVYRNVFEAKGKGIEWSWVAFDDSQIVKMPEMFGVDAVSADIAVGCTPKLRGAGPMRENERRGRGRLVRKADVAKFREAVIGWAGGAGIVWDRTFDLDYKPSFGECKPQNDLSTYGSGDSGLKIDVRSSTGEVYITPFSAESTSRDLMSGVKSDYSETFFDQETGQGSSKETVTWLPGETPETFVTRLDAVYGQMQRQFCAEHVATKNPQSASLRL